MLREDTLLFSFTENLESTVLCQWTFAVSFRFTHLHPPSHNLRMNQFLDFDVPSSKDESVLGF